MIAGQPLHLVERPLVVVEPEPGHAVEDRLRGLRGGALEIGILDAQDEVAAMPAGISPGKQRGAGTADVEITGGTGSETGTNHSSGRGENSLRLAEVWLTVELADPLFYARQPLPAGSFTSFESGNNRGRGYSPHEARIFRSPSPLRRAASRLLHL